LSLPVFRKLEYWDEELKEPLPDKTISFEEYLEIVYKTKILETPTVAFENSAKHSGR